MDLFKQDIFGKNFSDKPYPISPFFKILQIDRDKEIKRYLEAGDNSVDNIVKV